MGDPRDPTILPRSGVVDVKPPVALFFCFDIFFLHPPHELPATFFSEVVA